MKKYLVLITLFAVIQPSLACRNKCRVNSCVPQPTQPAQPTMRSHSEVAPNQDFLRDALPEPTFNASEMESQINEYKRLQAEWNKQQLAAQEDDEDNNSDDFKKSSNPGIEMQKTEFARLQAELKKKQLAAQEDDEDNNSNDFEKTLKLGIEMQKTEYARLQIERNKQQSAAQEDAMDKLVARAFISLPDIITRYNSVFPSTPINDDNMREKDNMSKLADLLALELQIPRESASDLVFKISHIN